MSVPEFKEITTDEEFRSALETILRTAERNGVSIEGGWVCRDQANGGDLDVAITRLKRANGGD